MIKLFKNVLILSTISLSITTAMAVDEPPISDSIEIIDHKSESVEPVINVSVKGMVCDFCARGLEKVFKKREEVSSIDVDLSSNLITLNLKHGMTLDDDVIKKLVVANGISVESINRQGLELAASASESQNNSPVEGNKPNPAHNHDHSGDDHSMHH